MLESKRPLHTPLLYIVVLNHWSSPSFTFSILAAPDIVSTLSVNTSGENVTFSVADQKADQVEIMIDGIDELNDAVYNISLGMYTDGSTNFLLRRIE